MTRVSYASSFRHDHVTDTMAARFLRHQASKDWSGVAAMVADEVTLEDRRTDTDAPVTDPESLKSILQSFGDLGADLLSIRVVAERGRCHALVHVTMTLPALGEEHLLVVMEGSEDGRVTTLLLYDICELAEAALALALLYVASLPEEDAEVIGLGARLMAAIAARDYATMETLTTPDMIHVDHRQRPPLRVERHEIMDLVRSVLEVDDDLIDLVTEIHRICPRGVVASRAQTTVGSLEPLTTEVVLIGRRDDLIDVVEFYENRDFAVALARLDELERTG